MRSLGRTCGRARCASSVDIVARVRVMDGYRTDDVSKKTFVGADKGIFFIDKRAGLMLDADVVGSFHPMVLHPPSHDKLELTRGVKVVSPRDGRDVVRGRTEAFHRVER